MIDVLTWLKHEDWGVRQNSLETSYAFEIVGDSEPRNAGFKGLERTQHDSPCRVSGIVGYGIFICGVLSRQRIPFSFVAVSFIPLNEAGGVGGLYLVVCSCAIVR